jgi:hypothetical protein
VSCHLIKIVGVILNSIVLEYTFYCRQRHWSYYTHYYWCSCLCCVTSSTSLKKGVFPFTRDFWGYSGGFCTLEWTCRFVVSWVPLPECKWEWFPISWAPSLGCKWEWFPIVLLIWECLYIVSFFAWHFHLRVPGLKIKTTEANPWFLN